MRTLPRVGPFVVTKPTELPVNVCVADAPRAVAKRVVPPE